MEGRADVLNLLKHGIKNCIAINGTNVPATIVELAKKKIVTAFVDGDRGGDLIIKELMSLTEIDYVTKAPDGKEVEEITKKEIHKAIRARVAAEQAKMEIREVNHRPDTRPRFPKRIIRISLDEKKKFKKMLDNLVGTRGAYILGDKFNLLGKVPLSEITTTVKNLDNAYAVVMDGTIDRDLVSTAETSNINYLVGMNSRVSRSNRVNILTGNDLK